MENALNLFGSMRIKRAIYITIVNSEDTYHEKQDFRFCYRVDGNR